MSNFMSTLQTVTGTLLAAQDAYRRAPLLPILGGDYKLPSFFSSLPNVTLTNKRNFNRLTNIIQYSLRRRIHYIDSLSRQVKSNSNRTETITNQQQICTLCMRLQPANTCIKSNRTSQTWMRPARMKIISLDSHI